MIANLISAMLRTDLVIRAIRCEKRLAWWLLENLVRKAYLLGLLFLLCDIV